MKTKTALLLTVILLMGCGQNFAEYEYLLEPQIIDKAPQKVMVYEVTGNPNDVGGEAFGALFSTFYKLKKDHAMGAPIPRARWPKPLETPQEEWLGIYAMPVPETVLEVPTKAAEEFPKLKLETWDYGMTAEILHVGSYTSEPATVEKLHAHLAQEGYEISGPHEEEYLKGPGMFGPGNPDKYYTIIRYPIAKIPPPAAMPVLEPEDVLPETTKIEE